MATYTANGIYLEATGTDITSAGLKGFFDANPTYGSCIEANVAGPKPSYIFNLLKRMDIGNGTNTKALSTWNCSNQHITIVGNGNAITVVGRIQMGDQTDGTSANGGSFTVIPTAGYQFRIDGGDLWIYGSSVYIATQFFGSDYAGATFYNIKFIDCDVEAEDSLEVGSTGVYDLTNSRIHHTSAVGLKAPQVSGQTLITDGLRIQKCLYAIQPSGTMTFSDVEIDTCTNHIVPNINVCNLTFINPDFTTLRAAGADASDVASIEFRYQLKITDAAGSALTGVSLRARDQQGTTRFDTVTNASGNPTVFTQGTLQNSSFIGNGGGSADKTDRANHVIRVRHPQYLWTDLNRSATSDNLGDSAPLVADVLFTYSLVAAAAITGVTITDHGGSPVSWNSKNWGITITGDLTVNAGLTAADIFHFIRSKTSYTATFGGKSGLDWHQMQQSISSTVRSTSGFYSGVLKGVRIVDQAGNPFTGVITMQADDGTIYTNSSVVKGLAFTGLVAGSQVKVFTSGTQTELFSTDTSGTSESWSVAGGSDSTVDYTVMRAGRLPIRVTGITINSAILPVQVQQVLDRSYVAPVNLIWTTNCTINAGTKIATWNIATTVQNFYSFAITAWIAQPSLRNVAFPFSSNGPNSFTFGDGWEIRGFSTAGTAISNTSLANLSRDGLRYVSGAGVENAIFAALYSVEPVTGLQINYQQVDGSGTTAAQATGRIDQLIQVFGTASYGNFDRRGFLALKVQKDGFDQAETDVVATYGNLEDQLYIIGLNPLSNGLATGAPTVNGSPSITVNTVASAWTPHTSQTFSIDITDSAAGNSGLTIMRWIRYNLGLGGTFQTRPAFNFHDLVQTNGAGFKSVRGVIYGDSGAALKGVRVMTSTGAPHPDFNLHTADDGTTFAPVFPASATATVLADTRVQLYNVTTATELNNVFVTGTSYSFVVSSGVTVGDTLRLRACKKGRLAGEATTVWSAAGATFLVTQPEDPIYTAWAIDGATVTEYSLDGTNIQIDANDVDGFTEKKRLAAYFSYALTLEIGIRNFYGAITALAAGSIRINEAVADLRIDNINATTPLVFTDVNVRLFRSNGSSIIAPTSYTIHSDYNGEPFTVETGVSGLTGPESSQLLGLPSAVAVASAVLAAAETTPIASNMERVNGVTLQGSGTTLDPMRPA